MDKTDRALMFDDAYKKSMGRGSSSPSQGFAVAMRAQHEGKPKSKSKSRVTKRNRRKGTRRGTYYGKSA